MQAKKVKQELQQASSPDRISQLQSFFKTGPGEYAQGDVFIGCFVPEIRKICKKYSRLPLDEVSLLLNSKIHEERLAALFILIEQFKKGSVDEQKAIYSLYLHNTDNINNWDLVDVSAHHIVGAYLWGKDKAPLFELAKSDHLWKKRIAMISTFYDIKRRKYDTAIDIITILVNDKHDLIHKAAGWMLREIGKQDVQVLKSFLDKHAHSMPRTMLRYAIEKLPQKERKDYLSKKP